ncbi:MAG: cytochrome c [Pseudomonadota bacterium]|nr:cytochrome c [Pseudomonadota bacterium]
MKTTLKQSAGLAALLVMLAGHASGALAQQPAPQQIGKGQHFYQQVCAKCHETGIGPVITGRGLPEATYVYMARHGLNAMPAFRLSDIDDATLLDLAKYLSATKPRP